MSAEGAAGIGLGLKTGVVIAFAAALVSALAVVIGFTIVPLTPGQELRDAARRLAAGLLCSFTLGPLLAYKIMEWLPGYAQMWRTALHGEHLLWASFAAAAPFIALTALPGFWIVAAVMRWFVRREGRDIGQLVDDARKGT